MEDELEKTKLLLCGLLEKYEQLQRDYDKLKSSFNTLKFEKGVEKSVVDEKDNIINVMRGRLRSCRGEKYRLKKEFDEFKRTRKLMDDHREKVDAGCC